MQNKMALGINQAAEGLATTVEASEGVVDSLCAREWDEGLNMGHHHQERWDVVVPGWVSGVDEGVVTWLVCSFFFFGMRIVNMRIERLLWHCHVMEQ